MRELARCYDWILQTHKNLLHRRDQLTSWLGQELVTCSKTGSSQTWGKTGKPKLQNWLPEAAVIPASLKVHNNREKKSIRTHKAVTDSGLGQGKFWVVSFNPSFPGLYHLWKQVLSRTSCTYCSDLGFEENSSVKSFRKFLLDICMPQFGTLRDLITGGIVLQTTTSTYSKQTCLLKH